MKRATLLLCLALSGCYSTLTKPGMTPESKAKDRYECEREAYDSAGPLRGAIALNEIYRDCMKARGYK